MKLRTKIILMALGLTLVALSTGINFSKWEYGHGTSTWLWALPVAGLACTFMLLVLLVWNAKSDK